MVKTRTADRHRDDVFGKTIGGTKGARLDAGNSKALREVAQRVVVNWFAGAHHDTQMTQIPPCALLHRGAREEQPITKVRSGRSGSTITMKHLRPDRRVA